STPAVRLPLFDFTFSQAFSSPSSRQRRLYRSPNACVLSFSAFRLSCLCISLTITVLVLRFNVSDNLFGSNQLAPALPPAVGFPYFPGEALLPRVLWPI